MILTDLYVMEILTPSKSHRYDCTASTDGYEPFEAIARKATDSNFHFYLREGKPRRFKANARRTADFTISNGENISGIYMPNKSVNKGYGDTKGTKDALLFAFSEDYKVLEVFVARGQKQNQHNLFFLFEDGELDGEMEKLRSDAKKTDR